MTQNAEQTTSAAIATTAQQWRTKALNQFLPIFAVLAVITATVDGVEIALDTPFDIVDILSIFFYIIGSSLVVVAAVFRQLPFWFRAGAPIAILFALSLVDLFGVGIKTDARFLFLGATILSALFLGRKRGFIVFGSAILLFILRLLLLGPGTTDGDFVDAFVDIIIFAFFSAIGVLPTIFIIRTLDQSAQESATLAKEAETSREIITQRNEELSQSNANLQATENQLRDLVVTLETPTVTLVEGVLLAPLVGSLDAERMQRIRKRLLRDVYAVRARMIIIDATGVGTVNAQVATSLVQMTRAIRMLGCQIVLTGISGTLAAEITRQGIAMEGVVTARSPQEILTSSLMNGAPI